MYMCVFEYCAVLIYIIVRNPESIRTERSTSIDLYEQMDARYVFNLQDQVLYA